VNGTGAPARAVGGALEAAKGLPTAAVPRSRRARAAVLPFPGSNRLRGFTLMPSLPSGRALLLGFALLGAGALAYLGARETSLFALRTVQITGAPARVAAHVEQALEPLRGRSLLALNQGEIEQRLGGLSDVAAVSFDRDFPHTLRVFVTPAHSIAVLRRGMSAWIVSSDGRVIRPAGLFAAPKLPRVWVARSVGVDVGAPLGDADAARAIRALAIVRGAGFGRRVATVRATDRELTFVLTQGPELRFGDATSLALKLAVAARMLPLVAGTSGYVDVTVPTRPIAGGKP
jgi:cell division septal protein FtsQ